ncbi:hypothetical protein HK096_009348, partial [Nowakowskiella sp. JEL0078]
MQTPALIISLLAIIVVVLSAISQGTANLFFVDPTLNTTLVALQNKTGSLPLSTLTAYSASHPSLNLGFWTTCQSNVCKASVVPGCNSRPSTNAAAGSREDLTNQYYEQSDQVCKRFIAARNLLIASLVIGLVLIIALVLSKPRSLWIPLLFSVVISAVLFTALML